MEPAGSARTARLLLRQVWVSALATLVHPTDAKTAEASPEASPVPRMVLCCVLPPSA